MTKVLYESELELSRVFFSSTYWVYIWIATIRFIVHIPSQAQWMCDLEMEQVENYADPTSDVKRHEAFIKFNASLAATKVPAPKK